MVLPHTAYRFGGEEFCILLRETDLNAAMVVSERLRTTIEARFSTRFGVAGVTASLGVAAMPDHATSGDALIAAADAALYVAKESGRNRVVAAPTAPVDLLASAQTGDWSQAVSGRATRTRT